MTTPNPEVRISADGALAVRNAPTRYRADGALAPWSVVYAPPRSAYDSPVALTDVETGHGWTELVPMPMLSDAWSRLAAVARELHPCPPPNIAAGYDLCPCGRGQSWPCGLTRVAWLAHGRDPQAEIRAACQAARAELAADAQDEGEQP